MLKSWLQRLFDAPAAPAKRRAPGASTLRLSMELLEDRIELATLTWTGAVNNLWSNANNWKNESNQAQAPAAGDDLIIPSSASNLTMNNDTAAGTNYHSITFTGTGTQIIVTGNAITIGDASGGGIFQQFTSVANATIGVAALTLQSGAAKTFSATIAGGQLIINSTLNLNGVDLQIGQVGAGAGNVRFQQAINGTGNLTKVESGIAIIAAVANFSGNININGGTLQLGLANVIPNASQVNLNAVGATFDLNGFADTIGALSGVAGSTVTLGANGALTVGGSGSTTTFSGLIAGGGSLTKAGAGTFTLDGNNTYTGATTVSGGTLAVNGQQAQSNVTVSSSGILGGVGAVGNVVVQAGGRIDPGSGGPGTLATKQVTFNAGSTFAIQLNGTGAGQFDVINAGSDAILLGGTTLTGSLGYSAAVGDSFVIAQTTGNITGQFASGATAFIGGRKFTVLYAANAVTITRVVANVTVGLTSSKNPSVLGDSVTFTAVVTPEAGATGAPTGTVEFYDGDTLLGTGTVDATGRATFTTDQLPLGSRQIKARYLGNTDYSTADSNILVQNVNSGQVGSLTVVQGDNQSATVNQNFATAFQILVKDTNGAAMAGVVVTFTAPTGTGPSGNFAGQGSVTATTGADGIAIAPTFTANTKAGAFSVIASVGAITKSINLTNLADVAAKLAILQQPTTATAGAAFDPAPRIGLVDQYDNLTNSTAVVTVALGSNPGSDTLLGTLNVNAAGGQAVFSDLILKKAAQGYTLVFTSGGLTSVTSNTFNVVAAAASKLVVSGATRVRSGLAFELTVTAQDQFGNTATGYTGTVAFSSTRGSSGLPANYTFTAADAGSKKFNVTPPRVGKQVITVRDTAANTTITSGTLTFYAIFGHRLRLG